MSEEVAVGRQEEDVPIADATNTGSSAMTDEDAELEAMKARMLEMEAEAAKLREMTAQSEAANQGSSGGQSAAIGPSEDEKEEVDARSVYVGNVDYGATPEEIQEHFSTCGTINRVTILCDKFTGRPKGYAYVEFSDPSLVPNAMLMSETLFRGRLLKVTAKRTNVPGMTPRGRGRGRGRGFRGFYRPRGFRGRGRGF